jgi:hypothetical protein
MRPAALSVVSDNPVPGPLTAAPEPLSERIRRLQSEAREMAREHVLALENALVDLGRMAQEIAEGGEAYPVGAREMARQLIAECGGRASALDAILARANPPATRGPVAR